MELFQIIPEKFFNLLSGKNQQLYVNALFEVFKAYEQGSVLGMDKLLAQQVIIEYLELHPYQEFEDGIDDSDLSIEDSNRERANRILRRFEECEWIDIDVNNDYVETLNFRDYAITIIEALKAVSQDTSYGEDENHEFRGYIYTVYSLIMSEHGEYAVKIDQIYKNTIAFVREIRKLDSRLKFYIKTIIENSEIKDLIHLLVNYKVELMDQAYYRLKTSDNVNKYKLEIIKKLEEYQSDPVIMEMISREYLVKSKNNYEIAKMKANKKIDDMIDIYNSIDAIIDEIDNKNKIYVNTTIAKIKFLLNDDQNVIGKLNRILWFTAEKIKKNQSEKALKTIRPLFNLESHLQINSHSLYTPRGAYEHAEAQYLHVNEDSNNNQLQEEFYKEFETNYSEDIIKRYLGDYFKQNQAIKASDILRKDMSEEAILKLLYILVYAGDEMNYYIQPSDSMIEHERFNLADFFIIRGSN